jgi:hypothetical protein
MLKKLELCECLSQNFLMASLLPLAFVGKSSFVIASPSGLSSPLVFWRSGAYRDRCQKPHNSAILEYSRHCRVAQRHTFNPEIGGRFGGHSVHNFAVAKSLTQSLSGAAWHSKKRAPPITLGADPARARDTAASARAANDREPRSLLRAYWSVYELAHRAPGSRRAAGSKSIRTEWPESVGALFLSVGNHSGTASH